MGRVRVWSFTFALLVMLLVQSMPVYPASSSRLILVSKLDGSPLPAQLHVLEDYDAFVLAEAPVEAVPALQAEYLVDSLPERTVISLNGTVWDTQGAEPTIEKGLQSTPDDPYFLVQFYGPIKNEWVTELEALGVEFLGYHPSFAYIVRMDPALRPKVAEAHAVQWVGRYHPAYRLAPQEELAKALAYEGRLALDVRGFPDVDVAVLQAQLEAAGAQIEFVSPSGPPIARTWAEPELLPQLAALPTVYRVEAYDPPELHNDKAAQTMDTWDVWRAGRNSLLQDLMGAGQIAGAVDSGLDNNSTTPTIEDFYDYTGGTITSRVAANQAGDGCGGWCNCRATDDDDQGAHGTHVAGSIVANGYNSLAQRGLTAQATAADPYFDYAWAVGAAPEARIAFAHVSGRMLGMPSLCGLGTEYATWENLYNAGARNVNNSWGNSTYSYGGSSMSADELMWDYQDYLVVTSAGNAGQGPNTCAQPANGKNVVAVGAALNHRSPWALTSEAANLLVYFSSRGPVNPTSDNRAKPDVVAPGADVLSTRSNYLSGPSVVGLWGNEPGDGDGDGNPDYAWSGGTSMSSPLVTGAATILRDYFQDIQGLGSTTPPSAALIRAALVNGAVDMGYGYESFTAPPGGKVYYGGRNLQGWGFVNVEQSITPRAPRSFFFDDYTNITDGRKASTLGFTASGAYKEYTILVADSSEPLKVTLTWTDRQAGGDGFAVDNLDLSVVAPGGTQYLGNVFSGSWSTSGGTADTKNNTEAVYIQSPAAGAWTIRVIATTIAANTTQPYALLASGGLGANPAFGRTDTAGRAGSSGQTYGGTAVNHFPSLKPLTQPREHVAADTSFSTSFRLTNWGRSTDTISLSSVANDMTGGSIAGVSVAFSPAGPFLLASGTTQDVQATITVGAAVPNGAYDVLITATSAGAGGRQDAMVIPLNVLPRNELSNEAQAISLQGPQVMLDFWASGQTLWAGYLSGESHNNGEGEVWASCSIDGGVTWTDVGQVDGGDGAHYYGPAIAGNATGSSVTFLWLKANSGVYARTWTRTSGCTGTWREIQTLATYSGSSWRIAYPDIVYDADGTILATWRAYDYANTVNPEGMMYARSTNDGASYGTAGGIPDASGSNMTHSMGQLALDTTRNEVWLAYYHASTNNGDIRLKRWVGSSNSWDPAGTRNTVVASTTDKEMRPGIGYVAATDSLWVTWHRYASAANASARLHYVRSNTGSLPDPAWGVVQQYPANIRTAEMHPAMVVGDASYAYIAYLTYHDALRGSNVYALRVPAAGGSPDSTYQLSATVDDPPLYARGNAGSPRLAWAETTVNGVSFTGPTVLYTKNPPDSGNPDYGSNFGVAQTLYNLEENVDVYLSQAGNPLPTAVELARFEAVPAPGHILLEWETAAELDTLGFHLYRRLASGGERLRLNEELIPAAGAGSPIGAVYTWLDRTATPGLAYIYTLENVDTGGRAAYQAEASATARFAGYLPLVTRR